MEKIIPMEIWGYKFNGSICQALGASRKTWVRTCAQINRKKEEPVCPTHSRGPRSFGASVTAGPRPVIEDARLQQAGAAYLIMMAVANVAAPLGGHIYWLVSGVMAAYAYRGRLVERALRPAPVTRRVGIR